MKLYCFLVAACLASSAAAGDLVGVPVVSDGDTLMIGAERVRLFGIDAPEGKQRCQRDGLPWLCGQEAGAFLRSLVAGQSITCAPRNLDRYGRIVGKCVLPDGRDLGAVMVSAGMALAYRRYGGEVYDSEERAAKDARLGVWSAEFEAPWVWRKTRK